MQIEQPATPSQLGHRLCCDWSSGVSLSDGLQGWTLLVFVASLSRKLIAPQTRRKTIPSDSVRKKVPATQTSNQHKDFACHRPATCCTVKYRVAERRICSKPRNKRRSRARQPGKCRRADGKHPARRYCGSGISTFAPPSLLATIAFADRDGVKIGTCS